MSSPPSPGSSAARRNEASSANPRDTATIQMQVQPMDLAQKPTPVTVAGMSKLTADQQKSVYMVKPGNIPGSMISQQMQALPSVSITTSIVQPTSITIARMPAIVRQGNSAAQVPPRSGSPALTHNFASLQTSGVLHVPKGAAAVASIALPRAAIVRPTASSTIPGTIGLSTIRVPRPTAPGNPNIRPSSTIPPAWVSVTPAPSVTVVASKTVQTATKSISQVVPGITKTALPSSTLPQISGTLMTAGTQLRLGTTTSAAIRTSSLPASVPQGTMGINVALRPVTTHEAKSAALLHPGIVKPAISVSTTGLEKTYSKGTVVSSVPVSMAPITSVSIRPVYQASRPTTVPSPRPSSAPFPSAYISTQKVSLPPGTGLQQGNRTVSSPLVLTTTTSNIKNIAQPGKSLNVSSAVPSAIRGPSQLSVSHTSIPKIMTSAGTVIPVNARGGPLVVTTSSFAKVLPTGATSLSKGIDLANSVSTASSGMTLNLSAQENPISGLYLQARTTATSGGPSHCPSSVYTLQPTTALLYDDSGTYTQTLTLQTTGSQPLQGQTHQLSAPLDTHDNGNATSATSTLAIPTTPSKLGASPRPSILRKRDHDGTPLKAQKNLSAALNVGGPTFVPVSSSISHLTTTLQITSATTATLTPSAPSPPSNSSSNGSTTLSASSSPILGLLAAGPDGEESTQSSSHFTALTSSALPSNALPDTGLSSVLPNLVAMAAASLAPAMEMSPRKKPRKQMLGHVMQEVRYSDEEMQTVASGPQLDRESVKNDFKRENKATENVAENNSKAQDADNDNPLVIKRPQLSLLGKTGSSAGWTNSGWKSRHSHFQRHTDVKLKDDRRPTVHDLANQKQVMQKIVGWKVHHLAAQIEDMASLEAQVYERLQTLMSVVEKTAVGKAIVIDRVDELIKGNLQRSEVIRDQLLESRSQILKVLEHQPRIEEIIHHYANKRAPKKRERT